MARIGRDDPQARRATRDLSGAMIEAPSPNFNDRRAALDMLVLHYTGMKTGTEALARLCDAKAEVSAHYLIEEDGRIFCLVAEEKRAWHAGVSSWRGLGDINSRSIGVEIVNPGHDWGYRPFPEAQMQAVIALCQGILARHAILPQNVVGHSDIAPARKQDPGELFDWRRLAEAGIGLWPNQSDQSHKIPPAAPAERLLAEIGYDCSNLGAAITAFQRRFLPDQLSGTDDLASLTRLAAVAELYSRGASQEIL